MYDLESRGAVVVTLENTSISACSSGSLVSKGRFVGLCLRFAEDFETSLDDWKPDMGDTSIMNLCSVSEGTYEVCSRTIAAKQHNGMNRMCHLIFVSTVCQKYACIFIFMQLKNIIGIFLIFNEIT